MPTKNKAYIKYLVACAGVIFGGIIVFYGFELVSIPGHKEHNEPAFILIGSILAIGSILYAVFKDRN